MKKNEFSSFSQALTKDGFEIFNIDSKLVAKKNENKLVINKHQEIQVRIDYLFVLGQLKEKTSNVSGIPFSEIKKLLKYEKKATKSLFETFFKMCEKYNWSNTYFSDYSLDQHSEIKYIEVVTDSDEYFTFVFIKDEFHENFMVFKSKAKDFLLSLQSLKISYSDLGSIAPSLKKII